MLRSRIHFTRFKSFESFYPGNPRLHSLVREVIFVHQPVAYQN